MGIGATLPGGQQAHRINSATPNLASLEQGCSIFPMRIGLKASPPRILI